MKVVMTWVGEIGEAATNPPETLQHFGHLWHVQDFIIPLLRETATSVTLTKSKAQLRQKETL